MTAPVIPEYTGSVPQRNQAPSTFSDNVDDFLTYIPPTITDINESVAFVNTKADETSSDADAAAASAASAYENATTAVSTANFKGRWSDATGAATIPGSYSNNGSTWQLLQNIPDITADEPIDGAANWQLVNNVDMGNVSIDTLMTPITHLFAPNKIVETLDGNLSSTRATTATYIDRYGVLKTAGIDEIRVNEKGALIEGEGTNLLLNSEIMNTPQMLLSTVNLSVGVLPEGRAYNETVFTASTGARFYEIASGVAAGDVTNSIWLWTNGGEETIRLATYDDNTYTLSADIAINEKPTRYQFTGTTAIIGNQICGVFNGSDGAARTVNWVGCQYENSPFATSYIPTVGSPVTRAADVLSAPIYNNMHTSEGSVSVEFETLGSLQSSRQQIMVIDNSGIARYEIRADDEGNNRTQFSYSGGALSSTPSFSGDIAITFALSGVTMYKDGTQVDFDPTPYTANFGGITKISIGCDGSGINQLNGYIKNFRIFRPSTN